MLTARVWAWKPTSVPDSRGVPCALPDRGGAKRARSRVVRMVCGADYGTFHIVPGVFTPVLAKHSRSFSLIDCISAGVDRMQRNFEPMRKQVEAWQRTELTDVTAKVVLYEAFVEAKT